MTDEHKCIDKTQDLQKTLQLSVRVYCLKAVNFALLMKIQRFADNNLEIFDLRIRATSENNLAGSRTEDRDGRSLNRSRII